MENKSDNQNNPHVDPAAPAGAAMGCRRCGACCTMHQAFVKPEEIRRIAAFLGITPDDWERDYDDSRWEYGEYRLVRHVNGACAFLKYEEGLALCVVHAVKPACCADWQPGPDKRECREGLAKQVKNNADR